MHKQTQIYFVFLNSLSIPSLILPGQLAGLEAIAVRVVVPVIRGAIDEHMLIGTNAIHHGQRGALGLHGRATSLDELHQLLLLVGTLGIGLVEALLQ